MRQNSPVRTVDKLFLLHIAVPFHALTKTLTLEGPGYQSLWGCPCSAGLLYARTTGPASPTCLIPSTERWQRQLLKSYNNSWEAPWATDSAITKEMRADGRVVSQHWVGKMGVHMVLVGSHMVLPGAWVTAEQLLAEDVVSACSTDLSVSQHSSASLHTPSPGHHALSRVHCFVALLSLYCLAVLLSEGFSLS